MSFTDADLTREVSRQMDDWGGPADSPLLDKGSDGLIGDGQSGPQMLREAYRRSESGASLQSIKRDFACSGVFDVTERVMRNVVEAGRQCEEYATTGRVRERGRHFRGFATAACPACGARILTRALRPGGCAVCVTVP